MGASRLASACLPTQSPARPARSSLGEVGVANVQKGLGAPGGHAAWAAPPGWRGAGAQGPCSGCTRSGPTLHAGKGTCEVGPHFFRQLSSGDCDPPAQTAGVLAHPLPQEAVVGLEAAAAGGTGEAAMERHSPQSGVLVGPWPSNILRRPGLSQGPPRFSTGRANFPPQEQSSLCCPRWRPAATLPSASSTIGDGRLRTTFPIRPFSTPRSCPRDSGGKTARRRSLALSELGRRVCGSHGREAPSCAHGQGWALGVGVPLAKHQVNGRIPRRKGTRVAAQ
ncbi:hypothetical protein NN561_000078 [Cricetulus griseus]